MKKSFLTVFNLTKKSCQIQFIPSLIDFVQNFYKKYFQLNDTFTVSNGLIKCVFDLSSVTLIFRHLIYLMLNTGPYQDNLDGNNFVYIQFIIVHIIDTLTD